MKTDMIIKSLIFTIMAVVFIGCGGVGSATDNSRELTRVSGGTAITPADLSLEIANKIEKNSFYNHFKYRATKDERMVLESILEFAITKLDREDCQESEDGYVLVFDDQMNQLDQYKTCNNIMTLDLSADTTYIFKMQYPGNRGYFQVETTTL